MEFALIMLVWFVGITVLAGCALWIVLNDFISGARTFPETYDFVRLKLQSLSAWDDVWARNPQRSDIIICLTTIPSRLPHIEPTLKSLLYQTLRPQQIRLHLPA